jgi:hypothetical protein
VRQPLACCSRTALTGCAAVSCSYASERLNRLGAKHWRSFSRQDYFDANGTFAGVLWCAPLVLLQTGMLAGVLVRLSRLMARLLCWLACTCALSLQQVAAKRAQLLRRRARLAVEVGGTEPLECEAKKER